jgi:hypothetical protein
MVSQIEILDSNPKTLAYTNIEKCYLVYLLNFSFHLPSERESDIGSKLRQDTLKESPEKYLYGKMSSRVGKFTRAESVELLDQDAAEFIFPIRLT